MNDDAMVRARTDLLTYLFSDPNTDRTTPTIMDLCYTAFLLGNQPNNEDGGPSDWFTDTKPVIERHLRTLRARLATQPAQKPTDDATVRALHTLDALIDAKTQDRATMCWKIEARRSIGQDRRRPPSPRRRPQPATGEG